MITSICPIHLLGIDPCLDAFSPIVTFLNLLASLLQVIVNVPAAFTYQLNGIQALWGLFRATAMALLVLFIMVGGFQMMVGRAIGSEYIPPREFIPRIIACALAANASFLICQLLIDLGNTIANTIFGFTATFLFHGVAFIATIAALIAGLVTLGGISLPLFIILIIILGIFAFKYVFQGSVRIVFIDLLIVLAPLALMTLALRETRKWGIAWFNLLITSILEVILEDTVLCLMAVILYSNDLALGATFVRLIIAISGIFLAGRVHSILGRMGGVGAGDRKSLWNTATGFASGVAAAGLGALGLGMQGVKALEMGARMYGRHQAHQAKSGDAQGQSRASGQSAQSGTGAGSLGTRVGAMASKVAGPRVGGMAGRAAGKAASGIGDFYDKHGYLFGYEPQDSSRSQTSNPREDNVSIRPVKISAPGPKNGKTGSRDIQSS